MRVEMKRRREELGFTQAELAKRIGVARSTYTNIELGEKNPSYACIFRIKRALDVMGDDIFTRTDVSNGNKMKERLCKEER